MERIEQTLKEISKQGHVPKEITNEINKIKDLDSSIQGKQVCWWSNENLRGYLVQAVFPQTEIAAVPGAKTKSLEAKLTKNSVGEQKSDRAG